MAKALDRVRSAQPPRVALAEAPRVFGAAEAWQRIDELEAWGASGPHISTTGPDTASDRLVREYRRLVETAQNSVLERLRSGTFQADGRDARLALSEDRVAVPVDAWSFLVPDFENSSASGGGITLLAIAVWPNPAATVRVDASASQQLPRGAWYQPAEQELRRRFAAGLAAASVTAEMRALRSWVSAELGCEVSMKTLANRLGKLFKGLDAKRRRKPSR